MDRGWVIFNNYTIYECAKMYNKRNTHHLVWISDGDI